MVSNDEIPEEVKGKYKKAAKGHRKILEAIGRM